MKFSLLTTALLFATSSFSSPIAPSSPVLESEDAVASLNDTASSAYIELPVHHDLETRQSATTCGGYSYSQSRVSAAYRQGLNNFNNGQQVGTNRYPHRFNNREGFNFPVAPPYQIFPIMQSGNVYTGGSPGPDRVVFNEAGRYAGAITHTGAGGNAFLGCSGTS